MSRDQLHAIGFGILATFCALLLGAVSLLFSGTLAVVTLVVAAVVGLVSMLILSTVSPSNNGGGKIVLGFIALPVNWLALGFFMSLLGFGVFAGCSVVFYALVVLFTSDRMG